MSGQPGGPTRRFEPPGIRPLRIIDPKAPGPMTRTSGTASPWWGSGSAAAGRYAPTGPGPAPSAASGFCRQEATARTPTWVKVSRFTDSRTDRGTDRTAARIARSGGYRLTTAVHRFSSPRHCCAVCSVSLTVVVVPQPSSDQTCEPRPPNVELDAARQLVGSPGPSLDCGTGRVVWVRCRTGYLGIDDVVMCC